MYKSIHPIFLVVEDIIMHIGSCNCGCHNNKEVNNKNRQNAKPSLNQANPFINNGNNLNPKVNQNPQTLNFANKLNTLPVLINNFTSELKINFGSLSEKIACFFAEYKKLSVKEEKIEEIKDEAELYRLKKPSESSFGNNKNKKRQNQ